MVLEWVRHTAVAEAIMALFSSGQNSGSVNIMLEEFVKKIESEIASMVRLWEEKNEDFRASLSSLREEIKFLVDKLRELQTELRAHRARAAATDLIIIKLLAHLRSKTGEDGMRLVVREIQGQLGMSLVKESEGQDEFHELVGQPRQAAEVQGETGTN